MKPFSTLAVLRITPDLLAARLRDRLGEVGQRLDDIDAIEELERAPSGDGIRIVNRWYARQRIPALLRDRLGGEAISWLDHATWAQDGSGCTWSIAPSVGEGAIRCEGSSRFESAMGGRGVRVRFEGTLDIDDAFIASVAGAFRAPVTALVESIATTLIPKNFRAAAEVAAGLP